METQRFSQTRQNDTTFDAGLQKHFQGVYNIMALGLAVTGVTAYAVSEIPGIEQFYMMMQQNVFIALAIMAAPMMLMMMLFSPSRMYHASFQSLVLGFVGFSAFFGALLGSIFLVYSPESIVKTFFITSATFAATSIWGYTTKRDLSKMGSLLGMAAIGLLLAIFVNVVLQSPIMHIVISGIGIVIYTGMTAWDTQNIKAMYRQSNGTAVNAKLSVMGALSLYMNFIMLFQFLLQFMGNRE
ncbi:MAG: BAX inhibitor (BI)-1/YccA family protein [Alphaproteobacteria bacterium]|nr:BAX inhibitor (BI)-1/YccA family protein [Alphaproteobacteria bacterium]